MSLGNNLGADGELPTCNHRNLGTIDPLLPCSRAIDRGNLARCMGFDLFVEFLRRSQERNFIFLNIDASDERISFQETNVRLQCSFPLRLHARHRGLARDHEEVEDVLEEQHLVPAQAN